MLKKYLTNNAYVWQVGMLLVLFIGAVFLRSYRIRAPLADWHSWRQADTAAVARNFLRFGIDPLRPRFDDLSNIPSGKDNPQGWRMVEFPLYQTIAAVVWRLIPSVPIEVVLRGITIITSALTGLLLGLLVMQLIDPLTGILASFVFSVLPYSVYYGRTILPDPFMVFLSVLSLLSLQRAPKEGTYRWVFIITSSMVAALALLVKPVALFLLLPVFIVFLNNFSLSLYWLIGLLAYWIISLLPVWQWRQWILHYPEGIAVYGWLFNGGDIRLKGAWFYWLFGERIGKLILGYWGLVPFGLGILPAPSKKEGWFFRVWLVAGLGYLVVIARGNVQHDYYQILLMPIIAVYMAKGFAYIIRNKAFSVATRILLTGMTIALTTSLSWYTVRTYYWINRQEIVDAGKIADQLLPAGAKVIAPYNGDTTFLYQTGRQGWPIGFDIDNKIKMGATHYVTVSPLDSDTETRDLALKYTVLIRNDTFAIIDLTKPKKN